MPNEDLPITDELKEKLKSPRWRMEHLYKIIDKSGEEVTFKFNFFQNVLWKYMHWRVVILKARQLGMSTFIAIFFLDQILFNKNRSAATVADKAENGKTIFSKTLFAWERFPQSLKDYLGIKAETDSTTSITFSNHSGDKVGTTIHSGTNQLLHISELGPLCEDSLEKAEQVVRSATPTVPKPPNTFIFFESTARNEGDLFHHRCLDAQAATLRAEQADPEHPNRHLHPMEYKFFFFAWWQNPEYALPENEAGHVIISDNLTRYFDETEKRIGKKLSKGQRAWYTLMKKEVESDPNAKKDKMKAEYPSYVEEAFLAGGNKLFDGDIIRRKLESEARSPIEVDGYWKIYARWKRGHRYGMGADVAMGVGNHHSTAVIIDFTDNVVVATYANNQIDPVSFGHELARMGRAYGTCIIAPEVNYGMATVTTLAEEYPEIYKYHIQGYDQVKETERLGWLTNANTKGTSMFNLKQAFEDSDTPLICPDESLLKEALYYDKEQVALTETVQRAKGTTKHADLLMAAAIANAMRPFAKTGTMDDPESEIIVNDRRSRRRVFG